MALVQISEPDAKAHPKSFICAAGIDLGTTNSLVAVVRDHHPETLPDSQGRHRLPSVVHYRADSPPLVGYDALAQSELAPRDTILSVKRLMGRNADNLDAIQKTLGYHFICDDPKMPRLKTATGNKSAVEVSADILRTLSQRVEQTLGEYLAGVVITVPAYFDDAQRQATKDAATLAGLKVYRLLNEPTAAAIAYGLDSASDKELILVYDLGGGTFDVSILKMEQGVLRVLATGGDTLLGGDDFDSLIAQYFIEHAPDGIEQSAEVMRYLLSEARRVKHLLSEQTEISHQLKLPSSIGWQVSLSRSQLETLIAPLVEKSIAICQSVLHDAGLQAGQIQNVVMVGGSTRIPFVQQQVHQAIGAAPLVEIDPDRVVALGAAMQADVLAGNARSADEMLLLDVVPLSLGLETMGGLVEKIIPRNSVIPTSCVQEFTTYKDGQTGISLHVVQGERDLATDCRSLARFELRGIPPKTAGASRIRVSFTVDADGLLLVTAVEAESGVQTTIEVKPSYGLSSSDIETMIRDSVQHAQADVSARQLREKQIDAKRVIEALDSALLADGDLLLNQNERQTILDARLHLEHQIEHNDADNIVAAIKKLEACSEAFVARRMNTNIQKVLQGHRTEDFE